ncbi:hypothetical protein LEMA_P115030.1 [Plenodomus lingam JN3]|uniref:Cupin type-2 domain-containing protein n=1 Tax=Leptosphaeria maculans (strain JN3 / isolate v23.1.3 / race Av1-4-5-6-7-8) TaxID=985895 RepID=E4ZUK9_LEPMJ|nr:hypothetical protein LEMA_P115030.1 [Plenodomus lingam JN3]CBX95088.1 hypothetical protein LEMA_P115030.1 [Plenodomus lingam JN3]
MPTPTMSPRDRSSAEVLVKKGSDITAPDGPQTEGMIRMPALVDVSDQMLMIAKPHTASAVHHHGEEDTIVFASKGHGAIVSGRNGEKRQELAPGDFALIPAYAEHQEVNDSDEDVVWIITRGGRNPIVQNLEGWSKTH